MNFNHLLDQSEKFSRIVFLKSRPENMSSGDIACYAIEHIFQMYEKSEKFREKARDEVFIESVLYNSCRRSIEKYRVYDAFDAMEYRSGNKENKKGFQGDLDPNDGLEDEYADNDLDYDVADTTIFSAKDQTLVFLAAIEEQLPRIYKLITSDIAKMILSEIMNPSYEMSRWINAERFRVFGSSAHAKMHYRAFEAVYGITQQDYHVAIRHIRNKTAKLGIFDVIESLN